MAFGHRRGRMDQNREKLEAPVVAVKHVPCLEKAEKGL
jgi:hypothetical protein